MRVIAGQARGRPLVGPTRTHTRPTSDKVKGALFSMLENLLAAKIPGRRSDDEGVRELGSLELWEGLGVLDLYAGTGALGIEALSRGAAGCDFVESSAAARRIILRNLEVTNLAEVGHVIGLTVEKVVREGSQSLRYAPYAVVLLDPPYSDQAVGTVVDTLAHSDLLMKGALVAVEHSRRLDLANRYTDLAEVCERRHGDTVLSIYRQEPLSDAEQE